MKKRHLLIASTIALLVTLFSPGCATKPPTALEQRWFNITTNYVPEVVLKTNYVTITNLQGGITVQRNLSAETNLVEQYQYTPGSRAQQVKEVGGAVGNLFGVGGLVTTGLGALFGLWAQVRSSRRYRTAGSLAQTIETLRVFVKGLPNGAAYDTAFVQFMQSKQAEAGVLQEVVSLLEKEVSNPDAKEAAQNVQNLITALRSQG